MQKVIRMVIIILNLFLAFTAIGGGIGLLTGFGAPPTEFLEGSPFSGYLLPGLALLILVGGSALAASLSLILKHRLSIVLAYMSATAIIIFELVEVIIIGSPEGVARNLQMLYLFIGLIMLFSLLIHRKQKGYSAT